MKLKLKIIAFIFICTIICAQEAKAYINPGTGSYFFQILASFFLGIGFFFKNILKSLGLIKDKDPKEDEE